MENTQQTTVPTVPGPTQGSALPSAFSLFTPSLDALKVNLGTFVALLLTPLAASVVFYIVMLAGLFSASAGGGSSNSVGAVFGVFMFVVCLAMAVMSLVFNVAFVYAQLKSADKQPVEFVPSLKVGFHYAWRYLGLAVVAGLITFVGLLLFIVPGIFMMKRYLLAPFYLVDRNVGVFEALKLSAADSKRFSGALWGLLGVQLLVALSMIIPIVGIILYVMYLCAPAIRYRQIQHAAGTAHTA